MPTKKNPLETPDLSGWLVNWAIELREFDIEFHPRTSLKGQAVVDIIVEFCNVLEEGEVLPEKVWITYVDESSTRRYSGPRVTNNEAEYEAMITGMNIAWEMGVKKLEVKSDSQVVVGHVKGEYEARREKMKKYLEKVKEIMGLFDKITFTKVPWEENLTADALAWIGSTVEEEITATHWPVQELSAPSIDWIDQIAYVEKEQGDLEWGRDILCLISAKIFIF